MGKEEVSYLGSESERDLSLSSLAEQATLVAFDAEWHPHRLHPRVEVLQLAFPRAGVAYVIHLAAGCALPGDVRRMLASDEVVKVGFAVANDLKVLRRSKIAITRVRDVQDECCSLLGVTQQVGLQRAAAYLLGYDLEKSKRVTFSDWARKPLTEEQITYAALDAWVALRLHHELRAAGAR
eukprot:UN1121